MTHQQTAWTAPDGWRLYPQYVNLTGNRLIIREAEMINEDYYGRDVVQGRTVFIDLPDEALFTIADAINARRSPVDRLREALTDEQEARLVEAYCRGWNEGVETLIDNYPGRTLEAPHKDARSEGCGNFMQEIYESLSSPEPVGEVDE